MNWEFYTMYFDLIHVLQYLLLDPPLLSYSPTSFYLTVPVTISIPVSVSDYLCPCLCLYPCLHLYSSPCLCLCLKTFLVCIDQLILCIESFLECRWYARWSHHWKKLILPLPATIKCQQFLRWGGGTLGLHPHLHAGALPSLCMLLPWSLPPPLALPQGSLIHEGRDVVWTSHSVLSALKVFSSLHVDQLGSLC